MSSQGNAPRARVLIVEDDPWMQSVLGSLLEDEGYVVTRAASGDAGLRAAARQPPDAILLDLRLPDISGVELIRSLKTHPVTKEVPVLALSGDRQLLEECGAQRVFEKPVDLNELLEAVTRAALDGAAPP